jgi:hypothetical protein
MKTRFVGEPRHSILADHIIDALKLCLNFRLLVERQSYKALKNWFNVCFKSSKEISCNTFFFS